MDSLKSTFALRVARGVSVGVALTAMTTFVVLEHRRLNPEPPDVETDADLSGEPSVADGLEWMGESGEPEVDSGRTVDTPPSFAVEALRLEVPLVRIEAVGELIRPSPPGTQVVRPDLLPDVPPADDLLVFTSSSEVYLSSSKFAGPPPKDKRTKTTKKRP